MSKVLIDRDLLFRLSLLDLAEMGEEVRALLAEPVVHDDTLPLDPWGLLTPCSECGDVNCNGECFGDDMMGGE